MKKMIEMQSKASPAIPWAKPTENKILEDMMRKLMEMRSKIPSTVSIAYPNQDLIEISLAESKRKEIDRKNSAKELLSSRVTF
ncbi:hypothetical protein IEQ34_005041 [Dendrobium chrysotoxum]|uniref:Uncharacterized protein n=1 Tax=Dendrobium chrysotoxum TaxID=161865 RepID=A0AAV7HAB4_DENCH|nr:hypothetical protein IEQ34_005041 [Dendrobium chrysotoxum]